jgi:hypothetical protein
MTSKWHDDDWETIVKIKDGEMSVCPGEFADMHDSGLFVKEYYDEDDSLKLVGMTKDGKVYVTEKDLLSLTEEETIEYMNRNSFSKSERFTAAAREKADERLSHAVLTN